MENKKYKLRYLQTFEKDLLDIVEYIAIVLKNPLAAERLVDSIERALLRRLDSPLSFEKYHSTKERKHPYYRIYVGNYFIYYVVIDDVMEVRRLLYNAMDVNKHL